MDGLELFNVLANEVIIDRNQHGKEFDNDFKEYIKQELSSTNRWSSGMCLSDYGIMVLYGRVG